MKSLATKIIALGCVFWKATFAFFPLPGTFRRASSCPIDVLSCSDESQGADKCCVPQYGLIALTQQWHPQLGPKKQFTLHGLWPDTCGGQFVENCDSGRKYDDVESRLKSYEGSRVDFIQDMRLYWSSYNPTPQQPDNNDFWNHEWNKHGTCLTTLGPDCGFKGDRDLYSYFNTTLALRKKYDIYAALKKAGITPRPKYGMEPRETDKYSVDAILTAIENEWNVKGAVYCKPGNPLENRSK